MSGRYDVYRSRNPRKNRGKREAREMDVLTAALTAQVLLCVAIVLLVVVLQKIDADKGAAFCAEYRDLTAESEQNKQFLDWISGFRSKEADLPVGWLSSEPGESVQAGASAGQPIPKDDPPPLDYDFNFDYQDELGVGGMFPVAQEQRNRQEPPSGATYAPVALAGNILAPVEGPITSMYAYRSHPISGNDDFHTGIDVAAEEGRGVLAALPGEVVEVGESEVYGLYITLRHASNFETFYAHCNSIIAEEGMIVRQGERIATVGQTGIATGSHLHFSVLVDGVYTNPAWILQDRIKVVE